MICRLQLFGPIRLESQDGTDLTPTSLKARGVLALLAMATDRRMTREALVDKLWSDREYEQGSNSLRQALRAIRAEVSDDIFINGNGWIALDEEKVSVDLTPVDPSLPNADFGADLGGIRDPEFETWLSTIRSYFETQAEEVQARQPKPSAHFATDTLPHISPRVLVEISGTTAPSDDLCFHGGMLLEEAASRAAILTQAEVIPESLIGERQADLVLSCRIVEMGGRLVLFLTMNSPSAGNFWTQRFSAPISHFDTLYEEALDTLSSALVSAILTSAERDDPERSPLLPFKDIFSFDRARLMRADQLLSQRYDEHPQAELLALRAYVRHTLLMERMAENAEQALEEAYELARKAVETGPHIGLVLGLSSMIYGLRGEDDYALDLAKRAVANEPGHALLHHSLSTAYSFINEPQLARDEAQKSGSSRLSMLTPAITSLRSAYAAIGVGNLDEALRHAEMAVSAAPDIRAAHRVVAALRYGAGDEEGAHRSLAALHRLEPGFSLDLMSDRSYPVDTLRSYGLLSVTKSGLL